MQKFTKKRFSCTILPGGPRGEIFGTPEARFCVLDLLAPHPSLLLTSCVKSTTYGRSIALFAWASRRAYDGSAAAELHE